MYKLLMRLPGGGVRKAALLLLLPAALAGALIGPAASARVPYAPAPASAQVPDASLTEVKVPGTRPMGTMPVDLADYGYKEREFYASGNANRYNGAVAGSLTTASVLDSGNPYRTRVLVRYPTANKFNGTVVVEWANVTIGADFDFATAETWKYLLNEGYAVAVVSAQRVGVERLNTWSPQRYGGLSVDVNKCGASGTDLCTGDPLAFDIYAQIAQALKDNTGGRTAPMPGLRVKDAIAFGQSQSAAELAIYYNTIQPLQNVFNGFVFDDRSGQLRSDLTVPAISMESEGLAGSFGGDQWTTSTYTRKWDVAGATHASLYGAEYIQAESERDQSIQQPNGQPETFFQWIDQNNGCVKLPPFTTVDSGLVLDDALSSVRNWYSYGWPAAPSISFQLTPSGALARDANGRVEGGIRLAQFLVPIADQGALNGTGFPCNVSGWHRYYTPSELKAMYHTHALYVSKVASVMYPLAQQGYVLRSDANAAVRDADLSNVAVSRR